MLDKLSHRLVMYILLAIVLFFILTSLLGFFVSVKPPRIISKLEPSDLGLKYENIEFQTTDGLTLKGWFIPKQNDTRVISDSSVNTIPTIILLHGYPADKGNILPSLKFLNTDYNLLLFDFRRLGQSEGKYSTVGARETKDLQAAVAYLKTRDITEVGVWGFSMGGAVALIAAPHAPEIKAIVTDSSYAQLDLLIPSLYRYPYLRQPLARLTIFWAKVFLNINPKKIAPIEAAQKIDVPVLIFHAQKDQVIPFDHALMLQQALEQNSRAEFWFSSELTHGVHPADYESRLRDFYKRNL